jgi:Helix-turn-helix of DDE superfamily endonuclease
LTLSRKPTNDSRTLLAVPIELPRLLVDDVVDQDARRLPRSLVLTYRATIPLSTRSLTRLAELLRAHRAAIGSRWRRLDCSQQALLVLAYLRNGDPPTRLAGGFAVSVSTAWRYIREAVDLLADCAPTLQQAMAQIGRLAYAILDGTLVPIDRLSGTADRRYYSGKHHRHGVNAQVIANPPTRMREVNAAHAKVRAIGERAVATLKTWKVLAKLHCCPQQATAILQAILVLQLTEEQRPSG